mmetsp:Transcript_9635/g.10803  ORF Transcript_9635/g.10803 Transcript_9635/m.10803 type:complete len:114 (+) Transcript_9635:105-446(+)
MKFTSPLSVVVVATATIMLAVTNTVEAVPDCVLTATDGYSICDDVSKGLFCKSDSDCQQISDQKTSEEQQVAPVLPTVSASNEVASATSTFTTSSMMMSTTAVLVAAGTVMLL